MRTHRPTGAEIAQIAGVSSAAVSYVLSGRQGARISETTRMRILDTARQMGYSRNRLATALSTGRSNHIGLLTPRAGLDEQEFNTYTHSLFVHLCLAASQSGLDSIAVVQPLIKSREDGKPGLRPEDVADGRMDGVIVFGEYSHSDWIAALAGMMPCVEIGSQFGQCTIESDGYSGVCRAVEHLIALGHRRIACWSPGTAHTAGRRRAEGFLDTIHKAGLPEADCPLLIDWTNDSIEALLRQEIHATAIIAYNDEWATRVIHVANRQGLRVPNDLSVVGFDDDVRATTILPALTTIHNPLREMARAAVDLLQRRIAGEAVPSTTSIPTKLILRDSTSHPLREPIQKDIKQ